MNTGLFGCLIEYDGDYNIITDINQTPDKTLKNTTVGKIEIKGLWSAYCYYTDRPEYIAIRDTVNQLLKNYTNTIFCSYYSK